MLIYHIVESSGLRVGTVAPPLTYLWVKDISTPINVLSFSKDISTSTITVILVCAKVVLLVIVSAVGR